MLCQCLPYRAITRLLSTQLSQPHVMANNANINISHFHASSVNMGQIKSVIVTLIEHHFRRFAFSVFNFVSLSIFYRFTRIRHNETYRTRYPDRSIGTFN